MVLSDYACDVGEDGTLVFACVELKHAGLYRFTVSNSAGSIQGQVSGRGREIGGRDLGGHDVGVV